MSQLEIAGTILMVIVFVGLAWVGYYLRDRYEEPNHKHSQK